jgi:hypothetical protein
MKIVLGVLSLLLVVAIVGLLAKKQLTAGPAPLPQVEGVPPLTAPAATPRQQVQQVQQAVEGMMQQPRPSEEK